MVDHVTLGVQTPAAVGSTTVGEGFDPGGGAGCPTSTGVKTPTGRGSTLASHGFEPRPRVVDPVTLGVQTPATVGMTTVGRRPTPVQEGG
jgi:hypothetical protein